MNPEIVLTVLLPPLLFAAASESSVIAIRKLIRSITQLAVGMVLSPRSPSRSCCTR